MSNKVKPNNQDQNVNQYNRTLTFNFNVNYENLFVDVFFNKNNNLVNFNYDDIAMSNVKIIRNLDNSKFANKFLNLHSESGKAEWTFGNLKGTDYNIDRRNSYYTENQSDEFYPVITETYNLSHKMMTSKAYPYGPNTNYIKIHGYGLADWKSDYLFLFIERTRYYSHDNKIKTRTAAVEILNKEFDIDEVIQ